jgi:hypothetical protein
MSPFRADGAGPEPVKRSETRSRQFFGAALPIGGSLIHATLGSFGGSGRQWRNRGRVHRVAGRQPIGSLGADLIAGAVVDGRHEESASVSRIAISHADEADLRACQSDGSSPPWGCEL